MAPKSRELHRNLLGLAIRSGLLSYVERKVKADTSFVLREDDAPLLLYAVVFGEFPPPSWAPKMVDMLLRYGANPNQLWHGGSPQQHALKYSHRKVAFQNWCFLGPLVRSMLTFGASPFTTCTRNHEVGLFKQLRRHDTPDAPDTPHCVEAVLEDVSRRISSSEASELQQLLRHQISLNQSSESNPENIEFKGNGSKGRSKRRRDNSLSNEQNSLNPECIESKGNEFERRPKEKTQRYSISRAKEILEKMKHAQRRRLSTNNIDIFFKARLTNHYETKTVFRPGRNFFGCFPSLQPTRI